MRGGRVVIFSMRPLRILRVSALKNCLAASPRRSRQARQH